jgi:hypothetical protein
MAYVIAAPEMMASAATDLATIGSNVSAAQMAAAARTVAVLPAAADEVSASIAHLFSQHAQGYQAQAAQAAAFNDQFAQHLTAGAFSYSGIDAANTALLQPLTAGSASIGSAIGAVPGQLFNLFTTTAGQLLNDFTGFIRNIVGDIFISAALLYIAVFLLVLFYFPNLLPFFPNPFQGITLPPGFIPF